MAKITNPNHETGSLADALKGADIFVGVSAPNIVTPEMVASMNKDAILFAMANPVPEIMPDIAKAAGVSTGIIYSYFTDKHDIFMDGLKAYSQKMMVPVFEEFTLPFDPKTSLERIVDSLIESHKIFNHAHKEIEALTMTNDEVAVLMADMELKTTLQLEEFLRNAGYDCENLAEKTHIIYNMVDSLSHELTFHKHPGLNPDQMKAIVIDTILYLLGTPHQS